MYSVGNTDLLSQSLTFQRVTRPSLHKRGFAKDGAPGLGGTKTELKGPSSFFGKQIDIKSRDTGGLVTYEDGKLSLGGYSGITTGKARSFGGGAYGTWDFYGCPSDAQ
jgi:hypothetical protein